MSLKFYQCAKCKKVIISREALALDGWNEVIVGSVDAAQEKHVPVVTKKCKQVKVDVGSVAHPMTEEHLIEWVAIETEQGYQVKYLSANAAPVPIAASAISAPVMDSSRSIAAISGLLACTSAVRRSASS